MSFAPMLQPQHASVLLPTFGYGYAPADNYVNIWYNNVTIYYNGTPLIYSLT